MKLRLAAALLLLLCGAGCYTVDIHAPKGEDVVLLPRSAPVETRRQWRTWFAVFGLVGIDDTMPAEVATREKLTAIRVVVIDTVPDAFIGLMYNVILPIGLGVQSIKVEGVGVTPPK